MIGLCGAHRTGKTTLAQTYADRCGLEYVDAAIYSVFEDMGLDPSKRYPMEVRLDVQEEILRRADVMYAEHPGAFDAIIDRTPLDFAAYTLMDAVQDAVPENLYDRFSNYLDECFKVMNRRFTAIFLIQPGIKLAQAKGKAAVNPAYIEHMNAVLLGLIHDHRVMTNVFYIPRAKTGLGERIDALDASLDRVVERTRKDMAYTVFN